MEQKADNKRGKSLRFKIFNWVILATIVLGLAWVVMRFTQVTQNTYTDNAQVKRQIVPVNSRVQGYVREVRFEEFQHVKKGDTLLVIDDSEYRQRLAQAEAGFASASAGKNITGSAVSTSHNNISVSDAGVEEVRVYLENAETNLRRYQNLLEQKAVTQDQFDRVKTEYEATKARYDRLKRQKQTSVLVGQEQNSRIKLDEANIRLAEASLEIARLNLSYTVIVAPADGIVGRKELQVGQLVQPGQSVASIVDDSDVWVVANYKEKQTAKIKIGDSVSVDVDAVPGHTYKGVVSALANATGAAFSLVPTDNATGNFVKVEQRIPVRITLVGYNSTDDLLKLKSGMSAEVYVK